MQIELIHRISRQVFFPPPKVDSTLLRLTPLKEPPVKVKNEKLFFKITDAIFKSRRKNLKNSLKPFSLPEDFWKKTGIEPTRRGETFSLEELAKLTEAVERMKK